MGPSSSLLGVLALLSVVGVLGWVVPPLGCGDREAWGWAGEMGGVGETLGVRLLLGRSY